MKHFSKINVSWEPEADYSPPLDKFEPQTGAALLEDALQSELKRARDFHREHQYSELEFLESLVVKHFHKIAKDLLGRVERDDHLRRLLHRSKDDIFPTKWMEKDKKVRATLSRYPKLVPLLNHVHNLNRRFRDRRELFGERLGTLAQIRDFNRRLGVKDEEPARRRNASRSWPLAVFDVHSNFYRDAAEAVGYSDAMVRKMIQALVNAGIYRVAHDNYNHAGRWRFLADGYFTAAGGDLLPTKHSFVRNTKGVVEALRGLAMR